MAKLTGTKKAWADEHVGTVTTTAPITGAVTGYEVLEDGMVRFSVTADDGATATWLARPPLTEAEQAAIEKQRAKEAEAEQDRLEQERIAADEQAAQAAENARQETLAMMRDVVREVVQEELASQ